MGALKNKKKDTIAVPLTKTFAVIPTIAESIATLVLKISSDLAILIPTHENRITGSPVARE